MSHTKRRNAWILLTPRVKQRNGKLSHSRPNHISRANKNLTVVARTLLSRPDAALINTVVDLRRATGLNMHACVGNWKGCALVPTRTDFFARWKARCSYRGLMEHGRNAQRRDNLCTGGEGWEMKTCSRVIWWLGECALAGGSASFEFRVSLAKRRVYAKRDN